MKKFRLLIPIILLAVLFMGFSPFKGGKEEQAGNLLIGWASADITPEEPVPVAGGSSARIYDDYSDPITATALVLESGSDSRPTEMAIMISVDLVVVSDILKEGVTDRLRQSLPEIDINKIVINATHTHAAPATRLAPDRIKKLKNYDIEVPIEWSQWGIDLGVMSPKEYVDFAAERIAGAVEQAWKQRKPGGVSFGVAHASVGQNRLTSYYDGNSKMYGSTDDFEFSHIEGYEDHSINLLYTWNKEGTLSGVMVNVAIPAQAEYGPNISADYWHETRKELRRRLGDDLFIFPQISAAGDQSPKILIDHRAEARMQKLTGQSQREQIGVRIADAVTSILPTMKKNINWDPNFGHKVEQLELSRRHISEDDIYKSQRTWHRSEVETVPETFERLMAEYKKMYQKFEEKPELKEEPEWYDSITAAYWRLMRASAVLDRYELERTQPSLPFEVHVIRIGDMAIATNPFELYLDFGMQMKARSKAVQTFVVQLAGAGTYVPTQRAVAGGAYGAIPQSTVIGPEGGRQLVNQTLELIGLLWDDNVSRYRESQD